MCSSFLPGHGNFKDLFKYVKDAVFHLKDGEVGWVDVGMSRWLEGLLKSVQLDKRKSPEHS